MCIRDRCKHIVFICFSLSWVCHQRVWAAATKVEDHCWTVPSHQLHKILIQIKVHGLCQSLFPKLKLFTSALVSLDHFVVFFLMINYLWQSTEKILQPQNMDFLHVELKFSLSSLPVRTWGNYTCNSTFKCYKYYAEWSTLNCSE